MKPRYSICSKCRFGKEDAIIHKGRNYPWNGFHCLCEDASPHPRGTLIAYIHKKTKVFTVLQDGYVPDRCPFQLEYILAKPQ